ncbi:MAG TPA: TIGR04295 family B12-binding domain-containing radical SAM protein [Bryobacteraceae bacterium]|nr:TIGR04295 family B12-binding domain-containing radical SAM protein [Bryobacteraceae bacterium]
MKYALVNPRWTFEGSIYFGCREPHLPLEYGYAKALLEAAGHEAAIFDGQLGGLSREQLRAQVAAYQPDFAVITTAPSYLFWRCAPPELRVPRETVRDLADAGGRLIAIGPHASTTPRAAIRKLAVDGAVLGEAEEVLPKLAGDWATVDSFAWRTESGEVLIQGGPHVTDMAALPALRWPDETVARHAHHHHRFEAAPACPGAEVEFSRGCPYKCTFCAKENFRTNYRKRPLAVVLEEIDGLIGQGIEYLYFIDEIFLPDKALLEALVGRSVKFGVQTRIDLWKPDMLELMGRAGCVSIEAGVESISEEGRALLDKRSKLTTAEFTERLIEAKRHVPFVQANLLDAQVDSHDDIEEWREHLQKHGVWANKPVPLFAYPGSPDYRKRWGLPDDDAWERALDDYLKTYAEFSDIQESNPLPLSRLETE